MRYMAVACDYDGTLALDGSVDHATLDALHRLRSSGRQLILVTGRRLAELLSVFGHADIFDLVVAENGATLYEPKGQTEKALAEPLPESFIRLLREHEVEPLEVGRVVVATWQPHENVILRTIQELGLELQVIFNKGAVMVLPAGINKASGLRAALEKLKLSAHNLVGVGDAENDHAFLSLCECSVAVANALPAIKENADWITKGDHGAGVVELIEEILKNDLSHLDSGLSRHHIVVGMRDAGQAVKMSPYGHNVLVAGTSGAGKSTLAASILEQLVDSDYQCCVIDSEGDYESFENVLVLGNKDRAPSVNEVLQILETPLTKPVVNLLGLPLRDRPAFLTALLPGIQELRRRFGRPHWLIVDEAHHMLGRESKPAGLTLSDEMHGMIFITVHPKDLSPSILSMTDEVIAIGKEPLKILQKIDPDVAKQSNLAERGSEETNQAVFWSRRDMDVPFKISTIPTGTERRRHRRKYAEGDIPPQKSFYFRGPENKLNLRASNLTVFLQLGEGVDAATWNYHLHRGDYGRWFREVIKDPELADETSRIQKLPHLTAAESRALIKAAVEKTYTSHVKADDVEE
jgi:HAD superfamily hydrolase (TIGR01484 family)